MKFSYLFILLVSQFLYTGCQTMSATSQSALQDHHIILIHILFFSVAHQIQCVFVAYDCQLTCLFSCSFKKADTNHTNLIVPSCHSPKPWVWKWCIESWRVYLKKLLRLIALRSLYILLKPFVWECVCLLHSVIQSYSLCTLHSCGTSHICDVSPQIIGGSINP